MTKFYEHLIEIESVIVELDKLDLSPEEKMHLAQLVDSSFHNVILDEILSSLNAEDKRIFVKHLESGDQAKIWKFLEEKVENIEDKIKKTADDLKLKLHKDIKEAKGKK